MRPTRRPFGRARVAVLTGGQAAAFDRYAIDELGIPSPVLIEAAGRCAADVIARAAPPGPVVVAVGKGNNGADGLVVARTLMSWGRQVTLRLSTDTVDETLLHGWPVPIADPSAPPPNGAVWVDAILGTGLAGAPRGAAQRVIDELNASGAFVVSLDIPSGVDATSGAVPGSAVRADLTIAFGTAKLGGVLDPGRRKSGRLVVVDIGFPPLEDPDARLITAEWTAHRRPGRAHDAHKNTVGAVCVIAGHAGMAGAGLLASRAALRAGAGYVRIATPEANRSIVQQTIPEAVFVDRDDPTALADAIRASRAVLAGPGMGTDGTAAVALEGALAAVADANGALPLVLDADALTLLGRAGLEAAPPETLITPHLGEMARITESSADSLKRDPVSAARAAASELGVHVLLKGTPSLVVDRGGRAWIATSGSSDLATAGMGDTLAGTAASLAAQGVVLAEAGAAALELTARASALTGAGTGMVPSDLIDALSAATRERGPGDTDLGLPAVLFDQDLPE